MAARIPGKDIAQVDRRTIPRRTAARRRKAMPVTMQRRSGKRRRQQVERRRQIDPTTCERDYTDDEIEFMTAIDRYRRENGRPFPTWSEVLEVVRALGYQKEGQSPNISSTSAPAGRIAQEVRTGSDPPVSADLAQEGDAPAVASPNKL